MKILRIYKENGEFVIKRINELNEVRKRYFLAEEDLKEALAAYSFVIHDYQIEIADEIKGIVKKYINI